jgi:hypothetical protein
MNNRRVNVLSGSVLIAAGLAVIGIGGSLLTSDPKPKLVFISCGILMAAGGLLICRQDAKGR